MAFGESAEYRTKTSTRRDFLNAAATAISGVVAGGAAPPSLATAAPYDADAMAGEISAKLFADDGLARPIPETPTVSDLAKGLDRTLVLGGGGEYYVAWYCGFFHGLYELGVDLNIAEMVVGTSAGSYAGSSLTSGHFQRLRLEFDFFGHFPSLFARLAPVASPNLSQKRAQEINFSVKDGSPALRDRPRGACRRQPGERERGRAAGKPVDRRQHNWVAGGKNVHHRQRLLHGREADSRARGSTQEQHSVGPRGGRQLVAAWRYRSDIARPAVLHGWGDLQDLGAHRCSRRLQAGARHHLDQRVRGQPVERYPAQHLQRDRRSPGDRYADHVDHRWHAHCGEPARSRPNRASIKDGIRARQGRSGQDPEILGLTLSAESAAPSGKLSVQLYSNAPSPRSLLEA